MPCERISVKAEAELCRTGYPVRRHGHLLADGQTWTWRGTELSGSVGMRVGFGFSILVFEL